MMIFILKSLGNAVHSVVTNLFNLIILFQLQGWILEGAGGVVVHLHPSLIPGPPKV